jgi:hypothetical protein
MGGGRPFLLPPNPPHTQSTNRTPHVPYIFGLSTFGGQNPHPTTAPLRFMLFKCPMCRCDIDSYSGALHEKCETDRIGGSGDIMGSVPSPPNRPRNRRSNAGLFNDLFRGGPATSGLTFHTSPSPTSSSTSSTSSSVLSPGIRQSSLANPLHPPPSPRHQSLSDSALYTAFTSPSNLAAMADDARARLGTPVHPRYDRRNNI